MSFKRSSTAGEWIPCRRHMPWHISVARASALIGETSRSRRAYEDFLALWKEADPDIPLLKEARAEYAHMKMSATS